MVGSLDTVRGSTQVRILLRFSDEILQGLPLAVRTDHNDTGFLQVVADRNDLGGGKRGVRKNGQSREGRQIDEANRAAIRLRAGKLRPADLAISARNVVHNERTAHKFLSFRGEQTGAHVGAGTSLISNDNRNFAGRSPGSVRRQRDRNSTRYKHR